MIKYDFKTYTRNYFTEEEYNEVLSKKVDIINKLKNSNMNGWTKEIDAATISKIKETSSFIKKNFDCLVVIGIGGSFLGSYAFDKMFRKYFDDDKFEIIYAGTTLSSKHLEELIKYLRNKNFCINVISKSGTTMETSITYKLLKDTLKRKYTEEELKNHIIVTTDKDKGKLREEVNEMGYTSFIIPDDIGGRYSFITPAHLLPLAVNYNIDEIIDGYYHGKRLLDVAYEYAATRYLLYKNGKVVENFTVSEENMSYFSEWLKQLFGETEGKNGVGILPTSTVFTRDLHSLGQFIQEGNKILFETFIKVTETNNYIEYNKEDLSTINNIVIDSVIRAHSKGNVPCLEIEMDELTEENIGILIYFFQLSAAFSGYLFGVEPFNQPGVEVYKQEVRDALNK
ncbi:MAG: glucose-6-phosphate isomerase [Mollicutes bacterium]|nr:glucose-6-phosphate isomerase [Mollicutes bacterium]